VRKRFAVGIAVLLAAVWFAPNRLWYRDRRPTLAGRWLNRLWVGASSLGLTPATWPGDPPGGTVTLEVAGRRSGRVRANVVTWVEQEGQRYLVSMLGEGAEWVRNVRAAGGAATVRHCGRRAVQLEDVPVQLRAPILKAYVKRTRISTEQHLGVGPDEPLEAFKRIAAKHPVFRIRDPRSGPDAPVRRVEGAHP
jgi:deazaflavin-dependent oxidoreductase (nitroreductase family)